MQDQIQSAAQMLVNRGLQYAFGVTGSGASLLLITELENLGVTYRPVFHEASAALMAGTVARMTNKVSVSISIKGPGLANMLPGIVFNHFEGNPSLSISEAFGTETAPFRTHKRLDHIGLLSSVVKGTTSLDAIDDLPDLLQHAFCEVTGPVHLDLCVRDARVPDSQCSNKSRELQVDPDLVEQAVDQLHNARRPIVIIGSLAAKRPWKEALDSLGIPLFTTAAAKGVLDERLTHSAGVFTGEGKALTPEAYLFAEADLVVGIGLRHTEVLASRPFGRYTIILDEAEGSLAQGFQPDILLTHVSSAAVFTVLNELRGRSWGLEKLAVLKHKLREALLDGSWLPATCFEMLNALDYPYGLVLDTGSFCTIGEHLWEATTNRRFLGASNSRYMGTAIPAVIGVAVCQQDLPLFCITGDGGMGMYSSEMKLVVDEQLPVCFVFMTDGRYGSVAGVQQVRALSRRAVSVPQPSWWKIIKSMGCEAHLVNSCSAFTKAVSSWCRKGPLFVEAAFDPIPYAEMTRYLR
jgi:acetolactate synthase-1/2/3 large subunit